MRRGDLLLFEQCLLDLGLFPAQSEQVRRRRQVRTVVLAHRLLATAHTQKPQVTEVSK